ncbi:GerAB/ArcD/ProY family transporter [Orenia marismortui]|uniref:Spore germination protein (Amino acid permease) n=1 Tax=Orenia marismortui TaxID=46469 RepID=A0A4R8GRE3_9FIRM|nr:GerAB/ArcD/ProY family transporter [Orenia marismortui]TDX48443.1 spore germination protein (amino acid permease) [Orenia marismortui]
MEEERISAIQILWISVTLVLATAVLTIPKIIISKATQTSWIAVIVAGSIVGILHYIILSLACDFSNNSLIQDCSQIFGKFKSKLILFPYILLIIQLYTLIIYEGVDFIAYLMPAKSSFWFWIIIVLLSSYLANGGVEVIARVIQSASIIFLLSIIIVLVPHLKFVHLSRLKPISLDLNNLSKASIGIAHWFLILPNILLILKPYFKNSNRAIKASLVGNILSQMGLLNHLFISITVFGVDLIGALRFPFYEITALSIKSLNIIIFMAWIFGIILKAGLYCFISLISIREYFNLKDYRVLILPFALFTIATGIFEFDLPLALLHFIHIIIVLALIFEIPFLIFLSIAYSLANKRR